MHFEEFDRTFFGVIDILHLKQIRILGKNQGKFGLIWIKCFIKYLNMFNVTDLLLISPQLLINSRSLLNSKLNGIIFLNSNIWH